MSISSLLSDVFKIILGLMLFILFYVMFLSTMARLLSDKLIKTLCISPLLLSLTSQSIFSSDIRPNPLQFTENSLFTPLSFILFTLPSIFISPHLCLLLLLSFLTAFYLTSTSFSFLFLGLLYSHYYYYLHSL